MAADKSDVAVPVGSSGVQYHSDDDPKVGPEMTLTTENRIDKQVLGDADGSIADHGALAIKEESLNGEDHAAKVLDKVATHDSSVRPIVC